MICEIDWSDVAPDWDRRRRDVELMKAELTRQLITGLGPLTGGRVLELGAGTGELAARVAEAVGPQGSVVASDIADGMVALLHARLDGLANVEVVQLDATDIALPPESVDVVVFRMGLMLVPEPEAALREIRRVLRPGGRLAVAVWGAPQDNPWMTAVGMAAMMQGLVQGGPPVGPGGPFSLADPVDLEKRVRGAGFTQVNVTPIDSTRVFADSDEHVDVVLALSPPLAAAVKSASAEQVAAVRSTVAGLDEQYRVDGGVRLPSRSLLCIAE
jgi:SAM-dependent methyltransferase